MTFAPYVVSGPCGRVPVLEGEGSAAPAIGKVYVNTEHASTWNEQFTYTPVHTAGNLLAPLLKNQCCRISDHPSSPFFSNP